MEGYNKLTKKLLAEGYTAENYPKDKVHIAHGCYARNGNPLDNIYGGFEYNRMYAEALVYKTGCGMFVYGKEVLSDMGFMGEEWCHENDNPVIRCPYDKAECPDNDSRLRGMMGGGTCIQCWCVCHRTDEPYDYGNSFEKAEKERQEEKERKYIEYCEAHNGRVCRNHMRFDERTRTWALRYDPKICANLKCRGWKGSALNKRNSTCPIMGRELTNKKGNVFYDLKKSYLRTDLNGTLFEGQIDTAIEKGIRVFDSPVSMDICTNYVKLCKDELISDVRMNYHSELYFAEHYGRYFDIEIMNIRAEQRESRDLMQDLQDIRDGIKISHASDLEKDRKAQKSERRKQAKEKRIASMEKKILAVGYGNMDSFEQNKACKLLGFERIDELEALREENLKAEQEKPTQMSLADFIKM